MNLIVSDNRLNHGAFYWNFPCGIDVTYHDGHVDLLQFATRLEAEAWLATLPFGQMLGIEEYRGIVSAEIVSLLR